MFYFCVVLRITAPADTIIMQFAGSNGGAPPGHTLVSVTVPAGVRPGMGLNIQTPAGQTMRVTVPAGVRPGMQFQAAVPSAAPAPVPASSTPATLHAGVAVAAVPVVAAWSQPWWPPWWRH